MRIAFACRDLAVDRLTGAGARVFAEAQALARAGHEVYLLSEELSAPRAQALLSAGSPTWIRVEPTRHDHRYLVEAHRYADWIWDLLRDLHSQRPLDVVEFLDAGAEGLTTIRAKRLLDEFPTTTLAVTLNPWATVAGGPEAHRPVTVDQQLTAFAERYCAEHADVTRPVAVPMPAQPPITPDTRTVWRIGAIRPGAGLGTFLRAAELVLDVDPQVRFVLRGEDTGTDPLGQSYWQHLRRGMSGRLRAAVTFGGPLRTIDGFAIPHGIRCVLPEECPSAAALAVSCGMVVVTPSGDPAALAAELLSTGDIPGRSAAEAVNHYPAAGGRRTRSADPGLVSVIIPLFNQGEYLRGAVDSVRAAGYPDVEIVVVDDGSTDPATVKAFDALTGVVKVRRPNAGLSAARNTGIAASSGRYIVPLDSDDELPPGFLAAAVHALDRHPDLAYVGGYLRYTGLLDHVQAPLGYAGDVSLVVNTHGRATGVYRRDALLAVGGYDETLPAYEDWDLHIRLHRAGLAGDVAPVEGQVYRRHTDSMTFSHTNDFRLELLQLLLRRHAAELPPERSLPLVLTMAQLWKSGYEPSASVLLQNGTRGVVHSNG
jgi:hypothetical protein